MACRVRFLGCCLGPALQQSTLWPVCEAVGEGQSKKGSSGKGRALQGRAAQMEVLGPLALDSLGAFA